MIDLLSLIQQKASIQLAGRPVNSRDGKEYHSSCPWCGGTDRFAIWPDAGRYSCSLRSSGCGRHGDAIQFLKDYCDMTYRQACQELDIDPRFPDEGRAVALPLFLTKDEAPNQKWMEAAEGFVWRAERYLWSAGGKRGLDYLHSRGLTDDIIRAARLGFCPDWFSEGLEAWGLLPIQTDEQEEIKIPEGIILPWIVENQIWKISVRRPDRSYFQVLGSSDALYNIDNLKPGRAVLLFESEFDALSVTQEAGDLVACIATGGTSKGRSGRWIARLKQASQILVCFDRDEAGDTGAQEWLSLLPKSLRWRPWAHDANDMLKSKKLAVRLWVETGLKTAQIVLEQPQPEPQSVQPVQVSPVTPPVVEIPQKSSSPEKTSKPRLSWERKPRTNDRGMLIDCSVCKEKAVRWGERGTPYCKSCWTATGHEEWPFARV